MPAHTHITVLVREHERKAHLHHNQQGMEIPYDNGRILFKRDLVSRGYAAESGNALSECFIRYDHNCLLKRMTDEFKKKYGVECFAALHHNKRKTNLHIHMIFAEIKRVEQPEEKTATRNMFYDEQGHPECTGIFKGGRRKELQKEFETAKGEYLNYKASRAGWDKTYGDKVAVPISIKERLR